MSNKPVFLLEVDGYTDVAAFTTERYSMRGREGYRTKPTDTPPDTLYRNVVISIGIMAREMFAGGLSGSRLQPSSDPGEGSATIANIDGAFDATYGSPQTKSFRERSARVLMLQEGAAYSTAVTVQKALISQPELKRESVVLHQKGRLYELDTPHLTAKYLGNNALPNGLEGGSELTGKYKPELLGTAFQVEPVLINTSRWIYQIRNGAILSATMYDSGANSWTLGADYASQADMETNAPAAGGIRYWKAGGMFRLASKPAGRVTVDATADTAGNSTAAQLLKRLALARGIAAGDINAGDVTALDTANSAVLGLWFADDRSTRSIMDAIAGSVGAYFNFDRLGVLRMARLELPSGTPTAVIALWNGAAVDSVTSGEDIPSTLVRIKYAHYLTTQSGTELAGSVSAAAAADLAQDWRVTEASNTPSPNPHKRTNTIERETLFAYLADASAEAARLLTLFGTPRRTHSVKGVQLDAATLLALDLNAVVELRWKRYGFDRDVGTLRRVIAIPMLDITAGRADLTLWGA